MYIPEQLALNEEEPTRCPKRSGVLTPRSEHTPPAYILHSPPLRGGVTWPISQRSPSEVENLRHSIYHLIGLNRPLLHRHNVTLEELRLRLDDRHRKTAVLFLRVVSVPWGRDADARGSG